MKILDAHIHFWKYDSVKEAWITDQMKVIQKSFLASDFHPNLIDAEIFGIAVQANQSELENEFLLQQSNKNSFIKGIVGWVDLYDTNLEKQLRKYKQLSIIKGFRHIAQTENAGFFQQPQIIQSIHLLGQYNYTFDILIYPKQLPEAIAMVKQLKSQIFILDHAAKPNIKENNITEWQNQIALLAKNKNVFCKVSGLITEANWHNWHYSQIKIILDILVASFGKERLLFGSDWPVMLLAGNYLQWILLLKQYIKNWSIQEQENFFILPLLKHIK